MGWRTDKEWADTFWPQVEMIVRTQAARIISVTPATDELDRRFATDYTVQVTGGTIACRIRRDGTRYRELTLRYYRETGATTEWSKIRDGHARWYLYAWAECGVLADWVFIDLDIARANDLLARDRGKLCHNGDGSSDFLAYRLKPFAKAGAIVATNVTGLAA